MTNNHQTDKPATQSGPDRYATAQTSRPAAEKNADYAKSRAGDVGEDIKAEARGVTDAVYDEARKKADSAKSGAADEISRFSDAMRAASGEMRSGSPQEQAFAYLADTIADMSDVTRNKSYGEMFEEVNTFARRNPAAFIGGALLAGFAGARFLKASEKRQRSDVSGSSGYAPGSRAYGREGGKNAGGSANKIYGSPAGPLTQQKGDVYGAGENEVHKPVPGATMNVGSGR